MHTPGPALMSSWEVKDSALTASDGVAQNSSFSRGGSYSAVMTRTGGACIPPSRAQPAPAEIVRYGSEVRRARSEPFPNAAEIGREIEFPTVNARF